MAATPQLELALSARTVPVVLRTSPRARHARLQIDQAGTVTLVLPRRTSRREAEALLASRAAWVERQLIRLAARRAAPPMLQVGPGRLPLAGGAVELERGGEQGVGSVQVVDGRLLVAGPAELAAAALERWYRLEARGRLEAAVREHAPRVGAQPARLSVRDQRTRWGSCSRSGTLSFSWRLALAPPAVLAYVVVHELCHLLEHSHRPRFWRLVETHWPSFRTEKAWLRLHGHELSAFDPAAAL